MKQFISENIHGVLGTIIFHLLLLIAFLGIKISTFDMSFREMILIDIEEIIEEKQQEKKIEEIKKNVLMPQLSEEVRRNIAVNAAEEIEEEISTEKYIEQLKQELNITDPPETWKDDLEAEYREKLEEEEETENIKEQQYTGETNVSYFLKKRRGKLYIPVYKCQGGGKVVVDIIVDQKGKVIGTSINTNESLTDDECLLKEAANAAIRSRFNADYDAPGRQKGYITYLFVPQSL